MFESHFVIFEIFENSSVSLKSSATLQWGGSRRRGSAKGNEKGWQVGGEEELGDGGMVGGRVVGWDLAE